MSANLRRYMDALRLMGTSPARVRRAMLYASPQKLINALCELIDNLLAGVIPKVDVSRLERFKADLRALARRGVRPAYKKRLLLQRGGKFMPALVPIIDQARQLLEEEDEEEECASSDSCPTTSTKSGARSTHKRGPT